MSVKHYLEPPSYVENARKVTWYPDLFDVGYWIGTSLCKEERPDLKEAGVSIWCLAFHKDTKQIVRSEDIHMSPADAIKLGAVLICKGINAAIHYRGMAKQAKQMRR